MGQTGFNFFHDEPLFGLDIGNSSLKVMQIVADKSKAPQVVGYGLSSLYSNCTTEGVISDPKTLGEALLDTLKNHLVGSIDTRRVACTVPSSHTFSRPMKLPLMAEDELNEAVKLEVERYVPMPLDSLYLDYNITIQSDKEIELATVAVPRKIIGSYLSFLETMGLESVVLEPTMYALSRLFSTSETASSAPSILVDFGSVATDLAVIDRTMLVNSTIPTGIDQVVNAIAGKLNLSPEEARKLKNDQGIANSDSEIADIVKPTLDNLVKEIEKIIRYHNERNAPAHRAISQVLLSGGGSTMPGVAEHLSKALNMPTRMMNPWQKMDFGGLKIPSEFDKSLYLTVAGEAILSPEEAAA